MSENAWTPDQPAAPPTGFDLRAYVENEAERLRQSGAPTMADWLDEVRRHPINGPGTEEIVRMIREARDADDPRDVA
jgi:hypothetical protein